MIQWIMTGVNRVCCPWIIVANCSLRSQSWTKQTACNGREATMDRERAKYWPQQIYRPTIKTSAPGLIYRDRRVFPIRAGHAVVDRIYWKLKGSDIVTFPKRRLTTDIVYIYIWSNVVNNNGREGDRMNTWTSVAREISIPCPPLELRFNGDSFCFHSPSPPKQRDFDN